MTDPGIQFDSGLPVTLWAGLESSQYPGFSIFYARIVFAMVGKCRMLFVDILDWKNRARPSVVNCLHITRPLQPISSFPPIF
jgi:hypothetical protein